MISDKRQTPDKRLIGTVIGRYRVTDVLDQGGMGAVYLAEHLLIGKPAVIKLLRPDLSHQEEMVHRFFNEAKAASAIRHPGIIEIFDFGHHSDGRAYIVMEHLEGQSLRHRLHERGRLSELEAAIVTRSIASALAAAHELGIVHRDLKPDNIYLVRDPDMAGGERIKVLDFGIAKLDGGGPMNVSRTRSGAVMGTPLYMAPEQARGAGQVDARADLYSLGCILYQMLCGRPPLLADGAGEIIAMQLYAEPVAPRELVPELSAEIEHITRSLLVKDPERRTRSASDVVTELGALLPQLSGLLSAAHPSPPETARPVVEFDREARAWTPQIAFTDSFDDESSLPPLVARSRARWIVPALAAIAVGVVGGYALVKGIVRDDRAVAATPRVAAVAMPAPAPRRAPTPEAPPHVAAPAPPPTIRLSLSTDPADAAIAIDGVPRELVDGALILSRDGRDHELVVSAPGHASRTIAIGGDQDEALTIVLPRDPIVAHRTAAPVDHGLHHRASSPSESSTDNAPTTSPNGSPIETSL